MADQNAITIDVAAMAGGRQGKVSEAAWRRYVVHMGEQARILKLQGLRKGKGVDGKALKPVKPTSRPDGATGPPLSPHRPESRSQKWLRVSPGHKGGTITLWWSHGWGKILGYHARGEVRGAPVRDVIGMTSADMRKLKEEAARWWKLQERSTPEQATKPAIAARETPKSTPRPKPVKAAPVPAPPPSPPTPPRVIKVKSRARSTPPPTPTPPAPAPPSGPGPYGTPHPRVVYLPKGAKPKASSNKIQVYEIPERKPKGPKPPATPKPVPPTPPAPAPPPAPKVAAPPPKPPEVGTTIPQPPKPATVAPPVVKPTPTPPPKAKVPVKRASIVSTPKPPEVGTTIPPPAVPPVKAPVPQPEPRLPKGEPIPPRPAKPTAAEKAAADRAKLLKLQQANAAAAAKLKAAQASAAAKAQQLAQQLTQKAAQQALPPGVDHALVQRAIDYAAKHGVVLEVDGRAHLTAAYGPVKVQEVHAAFDSKANRVFLNLDTEYWRNPSAVATEWRDTNFTSTDNIDHGIIHEVGHALHFRAGEDAYRRLRKEAFNDAQKARIRTEVSRYAATNPVEFVAEVYAGLQSGKSYSNVIMRYYDKIKGPRP